MGTGSQKDTLNERAAQCVERLQTGLTSAASVLDGTREIPVAPGIYSWWVLNDALPDVPLAPHSDRRDVGLLYVGIAPSREGSRQTLQSRILRNHLGGNTNNSTFRFSLASLLVDSLALKPLVRGGHIYLPNDQNTALTDWLRANAFVSWYTVDEPWVIEPAVIERMKPPANLDDNLHHPFYAKMKRLRAAFRATALGATAPSLNLFREETIPMQGTKNLAAINAALQDSARRAGGSVTPKEAAKRLEQLGLLKDRKDKQGARLRDLLRAKLIDGAWQDGSRRWHIDAIDGKDSTRT